MFDLGFSELLIVAVVALIVLGPERLPKATRFAGLWVRRARNQWASVKDELERDLASDDLKRTMKEAREAMRDTEQSVRASADEAREEFEQMRTAVAADAKPEGEIHGENSTEALVDSDPDEGTLLASATELTYEEELQDEAAEDAGDAPAPGADAHPDLFADHAPAPDAGAEPSPEDERRNS